MMFAKVKFFFKKFDTFQKLFTFLGCGFGLLLAIILLVSGIAAIPFTGGASLLPTAAAIPFFIFLLTGGMGSAGKYIGLSIDTIIDKEKPTNEKLATLIGCAIGALLTILAFPLKFVGVGFIVEFIHVPLWEIALLFVPLTIGAFGSAASYIARVCDTAFNQKTILDLLFKPKLEDNQTTIVNAIFPPQQKTHSCQNNAIDNKQLESTLEKTQSQDINVKRSRPTLIKARSCQQIINKNQKKPVLESSPSSFFIQGIHSYLNMPRYDNSHLHWTSIFFDNKRGLNRALTYLQLFRAAQSELEKDIIAYSLFASLEGKTLQKVVFTKMGFHSLSVAQAFFKNKIDSGILTKQTEKKQSEINKDIPVQKKLDHRVIAEIVKKANNNVSVSSGKYTEAISSLRKFI
jgi:hypothetical protein